jgi:hypothetical protein
MLHLRMSLNPSKHWLLYVPRALTLKDWIFHTECILWFVLFSEINGDCLPKLHYLIQVTMNKYKVLPQRLAYKIPIIFDDIRKNTPLNTQNVCRSEDLFKP